MAKLSITLTVTLLAVLIFQLLETIQGRVNSSPSCPAGSSRNYNPDYRRSCICDNSTEALNTAGTACVVKKQHGESCSGEGGCDPFIKDLSCRNGFCECKEPGSWDPEGSICYSQNFCEQYGYNFYDREVATNKCVARIRLDYDTTRRKPKLTCPLNSTVILNKDRPQHGYSSTSLCECNPGLTEQTDKKTCVPIKHKGEECSPLKKDRCDPLVLLSCLNETTQAGEPSHICGCEEHLVWDKHKKACRIPVRIGSELKCYLSTPANGNTDSDCIFGAYCETPSNEYHRAGTCKCNEGYSAVNGLCLMNHGLPCQGQGDCKPPYVCIDGLCGCPDPVLQRHDAKLDTCPALVGSSCSVSSNCTENAECQDGVCKCLTGFQNRQDGYCSFAKTYGEPCSALECDNFEGLICSEGSCACISSELRHVTDLGCVGKVGSPCGVLTPFGKCSDPLKRCDYVVRCPTAMQCSPVCEGLNCLIRYKDVPWQCMLEN